MKVNVEASLETRTSKKGNEYEVLVIKIDKDIQKLVFLEPAEIKLIKMANNLDDDFPLN